MIQINKFNLTIGDKMDSFYGNGSKIGTQIVTRITDSSCFFGEQRESWNTVNTHIKNGIYKLI